MADATATGPVGPQTADDPLARQHLEAVVQSSQDAILTKDRDAIITSWNPAAERMYGYSAEEAIGRPIAILIPRHRAGEERRILDRILDGGRVDHYISERRHSSGRLLSVSLSVSPLTDETGAIIGASVIARDVTELQRSRKLASRLHSVTVALSKEITPERTVEVLLEQAVAGLGADAGALGLLTPAGDEVELVGNTGYSGPGLAGWERFALDADLPMSLAIRSGDPVWMESTEQLRARFPLLEREPAAIQFEALAVIPLAVEGHPFGALALSFQTQRAFDAEERAFLGAAAQQAAYTLERARLYDSERRARERLSFLAAASELLAGSLDPDAALQRLADLAVNRFADWCGIDLVDEDGGLRNVVTLHADPDRMRLARELRASYPIDPDSPTGVPQVIRSGEAELYGEVGDEVLVERAVDDEHLRLMRELGVVSMMIVPLQARGRILGAMTLVAAESGRHFGEVDLELAGDLARRAALAIDNAIVYQREHQAALTLQRSLLPQSLPELDEVEFAARYEPAATGIEVGGDWYEAVALEDGTVAVTIGDVAGRGIEAASIMGRARTALHAYVLDGNPPAEAVCKLDALMRESEGLQMTTLFHLHLDPASHSAEYVRAGHPPALLRLPGGEVQTLEGEGPPPLGVVDGIECRAHRVEMPPGSLLLLYTDGLIERRGVHVERGLESLRAAFADAPANPGGCLEWVGEYFGIEAVPDDVAMLAMAIGAGDGSD